MLVRALWIGDSLADSLPTTKYYQALGGINLKASQYEMSTAQFLDLRNVDFDVPNALQQRPGQTYAIGSSNGTSGPINSLFEYVKLDGSSFIVAGSDSAMFYVANNGLTLLTAGWSNGQPTDMLTFVNKLWMANGQNWRSFNGTTVVPSGLPMPPRASMDLSGGGGGYTSSFLFNPFAYSSAGSSGFLVAGATMILSPGVTTVTRAVYMAYAYVRNDGYVGPCDLQNTARNIVMSSPTNGSEVVGSAVWGVGGFTIPSGYGISGVALYFAEDTIYSTSTQEVIPGVGTAPVGRLGWMETHASKVFASITLKPNADLSRFWLFTLIPGASLFLSNSSAFGGATFWAATNIAYASFTTYDGSADLVSGFSGSPFDFFATYTPKYIEVNNNTMFAAGFSSAPSSVWFSEVGEPEAFFVDSNFEVRTNDGDQIYATKSYQNQLLVMKENSFHKLVGDSSDNYQLIQISDQYGCLSNKSVLQYDQKILWLDKKGILEFNGANHNIISGPIEQIFRRMNISAAKEKACGVHHVYRNQLWWGIPVDGSTRNNLTVVYDYLIGAWTFFDGFSPASFATIKGGLTRPTAWRGDYSGMIHYFGESFYSDSGQGISTVIRTRYENVGGENQTTLWRRFFLDVATASGVTGAITGKVFSNYDSSTVQATFTIYQNQFQSRSEMGVPAKAVSVELGRFSASLPLLINGYAWSQRGLRNV